MFPLKNLAGNELISSWCIVAVIPPTYQIEGERQVSGLSSSELTSLATAKCVSDLKIYDFKPHQWLSASLQ